MKRRGNGLSAERYAPLVDLAPHLADALLTALGDAGVAAYATTPEEIAALAGDPLDRLYVDIDMKPTAEGILRVHLTRLREPDIEVPDLDPSDLDSSDLDTPNLDAAKADSSSDAVAPGDTAQKDEDAIWAEIVAGFDATYEGDRVPWPDQENIEEPPEPPQDGDDRTGRLPRARVIKSADDEPEMPEPSDDEHFIPPPPPPLPSADPLTKAAWIALIGGPVYLMVTVILDWSVPGWAAFMAVAAFIGGFVTLVLRMGDEPRGPDDGAVV